MSLFHLTEYAYELLKAEETLSDVKIIKAYPFKDKPVRLKNTVIAVMPSRLESEAVSIGGEKQSAEISLSLALYTPIQRGSSELLTVAERAVNALLKLRPSKISLCETEEAEALGCIKCVCTFTFSLSFESSIEVNYGE